MKQQGDRPKGRSPCRLFLCPASLRRQGQIFKVFPVPAAAGTAALYSAYRLTRRSACRAFR